MDALNEKEAPPSGSADTANIRHTNSVSEEVALCGDKEERPEAVAVVKDVLVKEVRIINDEI